VKQNEEFIHCFCHQRKTNTFLPCPCYPWQGYPADSCPS